MSAVAEVISLLEVHPAAELFPLLNRAEYEAFKADIKAQGLQQPIWLCDGKILDGRNRYQACMELQIEPRFVTYEGDSPAEFVWSLNGTRRHLTKSQLTAIAVNMLPLFEEEAKKRQQFHGGTAPGKSLRADPAISDKGPAIKHAAKVVKVGATNVRYANAIKKTNPALFKQIESGETSVNKAIAIHKGVAPPPKSLRKQQPRDQRIADIKRLASEGNRAEQIGAALNIGIQQVRKLAHIGGVELPDANFGKVHRINVRRVIEETVNGLAGYALGLQIINGAPWNGFTADDAKHWAESLKESTKPLSKLRSKLLEIAHGEA